MDIREEFKDALLKARKGRNLYAVFYSLVLIHADKLEVEEPLPFCRSVGLSDGYKTEFQKAISAARMLRRLGYRVTRDSQCG